MSWPATEPIELGPRSTPVHDENTSSWISVITQYVHRKDTCWIRASRCFADNLRQTCQNCKESHVSGILRRRFELNLRLGKMRVPALSFPTGPNMFLRRSKAPHRRVRKRS